MSDEADPVFYPCKWRLVHIATNIAVAPILLYLFRIWSWPPTAVHLGVFMITSIIALRFYRARLGKPRLRFDENGIHADASYPSQAIVGVRPSIGALKVWVDEGQGPQEKTINLWWASKDDIQTIVRLASERFGPMDEPARK